jgi:two-component system, OmpR family, alkaline phosphatase synthesis response regulator PhoP
MKAKISTGSIAKTRILIADDDHAVRSALSSSLSNHGFWVLAVASGKAAVAKAAEEQPHLILLDKGMPDLNGFDVCQTLKDNPATASIPIIFYSGEGTDSNVVEGLGLGAEDFITKPVKIEVLLARIKAALRRTETDEITESVLTLHNLQIDKNRHRVLVDRNEIHLSPTEFKILSFLAKKPGWVFSREQIVDHLNQGEKVVTERSVDVQMAGLRKKLGPGAAELIETVRGTGYRLRE